MINIITLPNRSKMREEKTGCYPLLSNLWKAEQTQTTSQTKTPSSTYWSLITFDSLALKLKQKFGATSFVEFIVRFLVMNRYKDCWKKWFMRISKKHIQFRLLEIWQSEFQITFTHSSINSNILQTILIIAVLTGGDIFLRLRGKKI